MLNLVLVISLGLLSPVSGNDSTTTNADAFRKTLSPSESVALTYEALRLKPVQERATLVGQMPSSKQSAIWAHHLLTARAEHPELTSEQRAVIQEALALLTPQLFEIDASSPQWKQLVDEPLRRFRERAKSVFESRLARELFTQLGPNIRESDRGSDRPASISRETELDHRGGRNPASRMTIPIANAASFRTGVRTCRAWA